jgi:hypothetical protein
MNIFHATEFVLNLPDQLKDKSVNVFALSDDGPSEFGVVIARDKPTGGESLVEYIERQVQILTKRAPLFRILHLDPMVVDKQPALKLDYTWLSEGGMMHQRQVSVMPTPALILNFTATSKDRISSKWDTAFHDMMSTLRFRT